jgi:hypothetical protein
MLYAKQSRPHPDPLKARSRAKKLVNNLPLRGEHRKFDEE